MVSISVEEVGMMPLRCFPKHVLSQHKVPSVKAGAFYVFEEEIVFCQWRRVFAVAHWRDGEKSVVDSFESAYSSLTYDCLVNLAREDLEMIRQAMKERKKLSGLNVLWGIVVGLRLRSCGK